MDLSLILIGYCALVLVMGIGVIGAFLPGIPGTSIILAAIVIWGVVSQNLAAIAWPFGVGLAVLLFSFGVDFLAPASGGKLGRSLAWWPVFLAYCPHCRLGGR
jgi:uncharacterized protein